MTSTTRIRTTAALASLALLAAACGDGETADTPATTAATTTSIATTTTAALPAGCEPAPFQVELRVDGDGPLETFVVTDAIAVRTAGGRAYTVYLADFPMDREDRSYSFVTDPPPGGTVVQTGLTVYNAPDVEAVPVLEGGEIGPVEWQSGELASFLNVTAEGAASSSTNMTGQSELLYVDDGVVCIEADITSERGFSLRGIYTAEITADF